MPSADGSMAASLPISSTRKRTGLPICYRSSQMHRYQRQLERSDSAVRQRKIAQTLTSFDNAIAALEGKTTYQSSIDVVAGEELPQTA